jgi:hypothetical protein
VYIADYFFSSLHTPHGKPNCRLIGIPAILSLWL